MEPLVGGSGLGFLASHGGSNMQAVIDACREGRVNAEPRVVISNNSRSRALGEATAGPRMPASPASTSAR